MRKEILAGVKVVAGTVMKPVILYLRAGRNLLMDVMFVVLLRLLEKILVLSLGRRQKSSL